MVESVKNHQLNKHEKYVLYIVELLEFFTFWKMNDLKQFKKNVNQIAVLLSLICCCFQQ